MNDENRPGKTLTSDQVGTAFRRLADEYATEGAQANEDTWAKITERSGASSPRQVAHLSTRARRKTVVWGLAAAAACGLGALGISQGVLPGGGDVPFGYAVNGTPASAPTTFQAAGELIASEETPLVVEFTDETRVKLDAFSTLRVTSNVKEREVTARLSQGRADFSAGEGSEAKFTLQAGVYTLRPMGATFSFGYLPKAEQLDVKSTKGVIFVTDQAGKEYRVEGGGKLRLPEGAVRVETVTEATLGALDQAPEAAPAKSPTSSTPASASVSFKQLASEGKFAEVVSLAKKQGIAQVLATASASDLQQLGQAARYTGDLALAAQTWTHMTTRFSGPSAQNARFFLGRLAEQRGDVGGALRHYDSYLTSSSGGVYTAEALGRKLSIVNKSHGAQKARPIAQEYLRRFPQGPYAKTARELAGGE